MGRRKKEPERKEGVILPAVDTIVVSRSSDGEIVLRMSRNITYPEASFLLEAAMAQLPVDER